MLWNAGVKSKTGFPALPTTVAKKAEIGKCHEALKTEIPETPCQV
jgi:hypothetical protein